MGRSTDAVRFSEEDIGERSAFYGKAGFALKFMLDTRLSDADKYPLKLNNLIVLATSLDMAPVNPRGVPQR